MGKRSISIASRDEFQTCVIHCLGNKAQAALLNLNQTAFSGFESKEFDLRSLINHYFKMLIDNCILTIGLSSNEQ